MFDQMFSMDVSQWAFLGGEIEVGKLCKIEIHNVLLTYRISTPRKRFLQKKII